MDCRILDKFVTLLWLHLDKEGVEWTRPKVKKAIVSATCELILKGKGQPYQAKRFDSLRVFMRLVWRKR